MKNGRYRDWSELPPELTSSILARLSMSDRLKNAQRVCRSWRRLCKHPSTWQIIDMQSLLGDSDDGLKEAMCRYAVDMSQGGLLEIDIGYISTSDLLTYVAQRSSYLRCLRLKTGNKVTGESVVNAVMKLPFLEELEIVYCLKSELDLKDIGRCCPLLKTLKLNRPCFKLESGCHSEALAIAETMPKLSHLQLLGNKLTNTGLNTILDKCLCLEHLDLRRCLYLCIIGDLEKRCFERVKHVMF